MTKPTVSHLDIATALTPPGETVRPPTSEQERIIEAPLRPRLVTAGAGSGKTQTMMNRVLWQVANGFVTPNQILGLTFTRKATEELRERLLRGIEALRDAGVFHTDDYDLPDVSTYNSFADRLYRQNALLIGYEPDAQLLDEPAAFALMREVILHSDLPELAELDSVNVATLVQSTLQLANEMRDNGIDAAAIVAHRDASEAALARFLAENKLTQHTRAMCLDNFPRLVLHAKLADEFQRRKRQEGVIQFADQVALARRLIEIDPAIGAELRDRFRLIIFDEYQDTSVSQVALLASIFRNSGVVAVGDPKQSIYGWRGASSENMSRFYRDFGGDEPTPMSLSISFRNDRAILDAANTIAEPLPESADLHAKPLGPRKKVLEGRVTTKFFEHERDEAKYIAESLGSSITANPETTAAVLVRTRAQMGPIIDALNDLGVPYDRVGRGGLLSTPEVRQLVCLLRAAADPFAGNELIRILVGAQFELGLADIDALNRLARSLARRDVRSNTSVAESLVELERRDPQASDATASLVEALDYLRTAAAPPEVGLSERGHERCLQAAELLHDIRLRLQLPIPQLVAYTIERSGIRAETLANPRNGVGDANLDALMAAVSGFTASATGSDIGAFLDWLEIAQERDDHEEVVATAPKDGVVQVLTMHAAKGLEWDVVALPSLRYGSMPDYTGTATWVGSSQLPNELRADRESLPTLDLNSIESTAELNQQFKRLTAADRQNPDELADTLVARNQRARRDEARRLLYVAMTRARHELLITGATVRAGVKGLSLPSEFWFELEPSVPLVASVHSSTPTNDGVVVDAAGAPILLTENSLSERASDSESSIARLTEVVDRSHEVTDAWTQWPAPPMSSAKLAAVRGLASDIETRRERVAADSAAQSEATPTESSALDQLVTMVLAERTRQSPSQLQLPERFGASQLSDILANPGGIARNLARPMPQRPYSATLLGNLFHNWVESLYQQELIGGALFQDEDFADDEDAAALMHPVSDDERAQLAKLQATFLSSRFAANGKRPDAVELPINMPLGEYTLVGKIDAVYRDDDGTVEIVDWKTGRAPTTPDDIASRQLQLMCYAHAYAQGYDIPVERIRATLFYVAENREINVREITSLETILELLHDAQSRAAEATEGDKT